MNGGGASQFCDSQFVDDSELMFSQMQVGLAQFVDAINQDIADDKVVNPGDSSASSGFANSQHGVSSGVADSQICDSQCDDSQLCDSQVDDSQF